jgi:6-phosphogluconolactonase (cycloisomerase 2 family)
MEIKRRMSTRFTWVLGSTVLVFIAFLLACGSSFSPSFDGLLIVPSQGSAVVQAFSFNLSSGSVSQVATNPQVPSQPSAIVLDPAGAFAYVTSTASPAISGSVNMISAFKITASGMLLPAGSTPIGGGLTPAGPPGLAMDLAGKFIFVADGFAVNPQEGIGPTGISVFSVVGNGNLTEVLGSPFHLPNTPGGLPPDPVALAVSPTSFPTQNAACSLQPPPPGENLYVVDANNNEVFQFSVNTSTGALTLVPPVTGTLPGTATGSVPEGVAVDPCNRFVYVANENSNNISEYTICNGTSSQSASCPITSTPSGALVPISSPPTNPGSGPGSGTLPGTGNGPGPMAIDPLGNSLYVIDQLSGQISSFRISPASGRLSPGSPATLATGVDPVSLAIRSDAQWLFVTNNGSTAGFGSVSEYTITPATGGLSPAGEGIFTDTFPSGTAVK